MSPASGLIVCLLLSPQLKAGYQEISEGAVSLQSMSRMMEGTSLWQYNIQLWQWSRIRTVWLDSPTGKVPPSWVRNTFRAGNWLLFEWKDNDFLHFTCQFSLLWARRTETGVFLLLPRTLPGLTAISGGHLPTLVLTGNSCILNFSFAPKFFSL